MSDIRLSMPGKRKPGRPKGSENQTHKAIKEAMKRKFGKVITPQKFGALVELVYDQAMGNWEDEEGRKLPPCKISQGRIFDYAMVKPSQDVESAVGPGGVTIVINDMKPEKVIEDAVWEEKEAE